MTFSVILFYILAAIVLYGAVRTVTAKNPVHAALHLVLTFCVSAMIWMLMQAEFLGVTLVVVYVGAVMVLFLFVVMMLNIDIEEMRAGFWRHALLPVWSVRCWRLPDPDSGQPENRPGRIWSDERHSGRLQQYPRFGQPYLYRLPVAV